MNSFSCFTCYINNFLCLRDCVVEVPPQPGWLIFCSWGFGDSLKSHIKEQWWFCLALPQRLEAWVYQHIDTEWLDCYRDNQSNSLAGPPHRHHDPGAWRSMTGLLLTVSQLSQPLPSDLAISSRALTRIHLPDVLFWKWLGFRTIQCRHPMKTIAKNNDFIDFLSFPDGEKFKMRWMDKLTLPQRSKTCQSPWQQHGFSLRQSMTWCEKLLSNLDSNCHQQFSSPPTWGLEAQGKLEHRHPSGLLLKRTMHCNS